MFGFITRAQHEAVQRSNRELTQLVAKITRERDYARTSARLMESCRDNLRERLIAAEAGQPRGERGRFVKREIGV